MKISYRLSLQVIKISHREREQQTGQVIWKWYFYIGMEPVFLLSCLLFSNYYEYYLKSSITNKRITSNAFFE